MYSNLKSLSRTTHDSSSDLHSMWDPELMTEQRPADTSTAQQATSMDVELRSYTSLSAPTADSLTSRTTRQTRIKIWLRESIDNDQHLVECELLALTLSAGIIDAISLPKFHCFVSNQTGNTVFFAIHILSLIKTRQDSDFSIPVAHVGTSLSCFCLGISCAGQLANHFQCKSVRGWLLLSNAIQTAMFLTAAILNLVVRTGGYLDDTSDSNTPTILGTIALLAYASGMQVALSRQLGIPEIPTAQATAAYLDLLIDPNLFAPLMDRRGRGRNRRIAFLVTLVIGSFVGAASYRYVSTGVTLMLAAIVKTTVTLLFGLNRASRGMVKSYV